MSSTVQKNRIPELRFKNFSGEWTQTNLYALSVDGFTNGVFNDPNKVGSGYKLVNVKDMYNGDFIDTESLSRVEISKKEFDRNRVRSGDILFTRSSLVKEGIAHSNVLPETDEEVTYDGHLIKMRPNLKLVEPFFLARVLKTATIRKQMVARGKTGTMTTIGQDDIKTVLVSFPSIAEQRKVTRIFQSTDSLIENLKIQEVKLKEYKRGMMQKIFSQEVRFKDENGRDLPDWETCHLGDIATFSKGKNLSKSDITPDGKNKCIHYGELYTEYSEFIDNVVSKTNIILSASIISKKNDILMPTSDVTPRGLATASALDEEGVILGGDILIIRSLNLNNLFFSYYVKANRKDVMRLVNGVTVYHLYGSDLATMKISYPSFIEQKIIAQFLLSIDKLIVAKQNQVYKAEKWKKGLLQKMFI